MTQDDITRMAREAGPLTQGPFEEWCKRFANLVAVHKAEVITAEAYRCGYEAGAAAEREACAKVVDHILKEGGGTYGDAIRARGNT